MWETIPKHEDQLKHAFMLVCSCCPSPSVHTFYIHMNLPTPHFNPVHSTSPRLIDTAWLGLSSATWRCQQHEQANPFFIVTTQYLTLVKWWKDYCLCWLRLQPGHQKIFSTPTSIPLQHMNPVSPLWVHRSLWPPPSFPSSKLPSSWGTIPHLVSAFPLPPSSPYYHRLYWHAREFNSTNHVILTPELNEGQSSWWSRNITHNLF